MSNSERMSNPVGIPERDVNVEHRTRTTSYGFGRATCGKRPATNILLLDYTHLLPEMYLGTSPRVCKLFVGTQKYNLHANPSSECWGPHDTRSQRTPTCISCRPSPHFECRQWRGRNITEICATEVLTRCMLLEYPTRSTTNVPRRRLHFKTTKSQHFEYTFHNIK